ncbi:MAG TPA: cobalamin biosynthesis protein [Acetobacteraceae bacterium]|nr:cobalamin biosynthesis protein [Acetobacteraceae bacterium]
MSGRIIAGMGCRRDCPAEAIISLLRRAALEAGRSATALAVPSFKEDEPGLREAARQLGLRLILVEPLSLAAAQERCVTRSAHAARTTGIASVAEGAALAAAGAGGRLILPRIAGGGATCALAETALP